MALRHLILLLTHANSCRPGRPHKFVPLGIENVLSPSPTIMFSKRGKGSLPAGAESRNKTEMVTAHTPHAHMLTCSHALVATIVHYALKFKLHRIISQAYHCMLPDPAKHPEKNVSP